MKLALGAWGIGAIAGARSSTWRFRFAHGNTPGLSIPPMSAIHAGLIEPFPLVLCEKVFIDAAQYDLFTERIRGKALAATGYAVAPTMAELLREFQRAGVLDPIDYSALVAPHVSEIVRAAEEILDSPALPRAAASSREIWKKFLLSPGGRFLPNREDEINATGIGSDPTAYEGHISISGLQMNPTLNGRQTLPRAAVLCSHDVFDATTMLAVGRVLSAAVCDWQMYGPIYQLCAVHAGDFRAVRSTAEEHDDAIEWYVPIPKTINIDDIWRLREDPYMVFLRKEASRASASKLTQLGDAKSLFDLRRLVQDQVSGLTLNTYDGYGVANHRTAFVERLCKRAAMIDGAEIRELANALLSAYPRRTALAKMLRFQLNMNLEAIAAAHNLDDTVFELLTTAEAEGWLKQLVDAAVLEAPDNPAIRSFISKRVGRQ